MLLTVEIVQRLYTLSNSVFGNLMGRMPHACVNVDSKRLIQTCIKQVPCVICFTCFCFLARTSLPFQTADSMPVDSKIYRTIGPLNDSPQHVSPARTNGRTNLLLFNHNIFTVHLRVGFGDADVSRCTVLTLFSPLNCLSVGTLDSQRRFHPKNHFAFGRLTLCRAVPCHTIVLYLFDILTHTIHAVHTDCADV